MHVLAWLLALVGPAVTDSDDGLVDTEPGLFLVVAVSGRHALLHVVFGVLGLGVSRDAKRARSASGRSPPSAGASSGSGAAST